MDAINTVDIVGAPTGSSTGQTWSQVLISSNCDIAAAAPRTQVLNSVGVGKYQEMLELKYANSMPCLICNRLYQRPDCRADDDDRKDWVSISVTEIRDFIGTKWHKPPFQKALEATLASLKGMVLICVHCAGFIRRNQPEKYKGAVLPMHLALKHIMSGGCEQSPPKKMLTHCIESLAYRFPSNPMLQQEHEDELMGLPERIQMIIKHQEMFFSDTEGHDYLCILRWIAEGSQHFMVDANFARTVRKYIEDNEHVKDWWEEKAPTAATCRNCLCTRFKPLRDRINEIVSPLRKKESRGYSSVIASSSPNPELKIGKGVDAIEESGLIIDGATVFCTQCRGVSLISYEYDCLVKTAVGGYGITPFTDVYYQRIVRVAEFRKNDMSVALRGKRKFDGERP